ncbi:MAG: hypothetical protein JWN30_1789 [Bacilli bacterium]|nr:hypothetical protein [Bacilli bacterium]
MNHLQKLNLGLISLLLVGGCSAARPNAGPNQAPQRSSTSSTDRVPHYLEVTKSSYTDSTGEVTLQAQPAPESIVWNSNSEAVVDADSIDGIVNYATALYADKQVSRVNLTLANSAAATNQAAGGGGASNDAGGNAAAAVSNNHSILSVPVRANADSNGMRSLSTSSMFVTPTHGSVSYKTAPHETSTTIAQLQIGQSASLLRKYNNYWYEIQVNNRTAYITTNSNYVTIVNQASVHPAPAPHPSGGGTSAPAGIGTTGSSNTPAGVAGSGTSSRFTLPPPGVHVDPTITPAASLGATPAAKVAAIRKIGESKLGMHYVWGHNEDRGQVGFDCSNYTEYVFHHALGYLFTTSSRGQFSSVGVNAPFSEMRAGDLVAFRDGAHVGIYMGNGQMLQMGGGTAKCTYLPLSAGSYWYKQLSAVKHMF